MIQNRWLSLLLSGCITALILSAWFLLAPSKVGGTADYIVIKGNSMEPGFQAEDLVVVRKQPVYFVGEVIAYDEPFIGQVIFHRIVSSEQDHLVTRGDNNSWIDSYKPSENDVIGSYWFRVARIGTLFVWLKKPIVLAALNSVLAVLILFGWKKTNRKQSVAL